MRGFWDALPELQIEHRSPEPDGFDEDRNGGSMRDVVDEVRALRSEVSRETDGFERKGECLRGIRDE